MCIFSVILIYSLAKNNFNYVATDVGRGSPANHNKPEKKFNISALDSWIFPQKWYI